MVKTITHEKYRCKVEIKFQKVYINSDEKKGINTGRMVSPYISGSQSFQARDSNSPPKIYRDPRMVSRLQV